MTCEPIIEVETRYIPLPGAYTALNPLPLVPSTGDNAALLDWAIACAISNRLYENQVKTIQALQEGQTDGS